MVLLPLFFETISSRIALRVAAVTGDDVIEEVRRGGCVVQETGEDAASLGERLVSANAYIGVEPIVEALAEGADVVITGRAPIRRCSSVRWCTSSAGR